MVKKAFILVQPRDGLLGPLLRAKSVSYS